MKNKILLLISIALLLYQFSIAQTFNGFGNVIPDDGTSIDFTINVSGLPNVIDTSNFGVETICINLVHTYDSDLDISLIAPDGTVVLLTSGNGGGDDNYTNTCFNQTATSSIATGTAPFTGTYRPQGQLGIVNNLQNPNGDWKLHILDTYPFADQGIVFNWSITFGNNPATAIFVTSSNLPLVIINTMGQGIVNSPKIMAHMGIIYNGPGMINHITDSFNNYNGMIGIETRGHSSQSFPQKQLSVETRDTAGNNLNTMLLGMPADNDWILYAPYTDKSCMRNALIYQLSNEIGDYAVRAKYCEVIINGGYQGIYELTETIKRGTNRVNIAKLTTNDTIGDDLTGGYITKVDWVDGAYWTSQYLPDQSNPFNDSIFYQLTYPKPIVVLPVQQNYIQLYVDSFETVLASANFADPASGWRRFADENSFIDFFILNEISKNVDGYRLSTFFHKDKDSNGGKIKMGPIWDFNLAFRNADYCGNEQTSDWAYRITDFCATDLPFWWKRLMTDGQFTNHLKCRWTALRNAELDTTHIFNVMDSIAALLDQAKDRHFTQWSILGTYVWPNPSPLASTYQEEIEHIKQWIRDRVIWIDANLPGNCSLTSIENHFNAGKFIVYPNPTNDLISINSFYPFNKTVSIKIRDAFGKQVMNQTFSNNEDVFKLNITLLNDGIYFFNVFDGDALVGVIKVVKL